MFRFVWSVLSIVVLMSCSAQQVSTPAIVNLKFFSESIELNVTGTALDSDLADRLTREIKAQLILAGFVIDDQPQRRLFLNVSVSEFNPDNAALRLTVGFGAGRGSLIYSAEYTNFEGKVLARMDGQERFTGSEIRFNNNYGVFSTLGGEETVRAILVKEAGKHIVELAVKPDF
jgi:hypothetical protein